MTFSLLITETVRIFRERWAPLLSLSLGLMFFSALMRGIFFGEGFFHSLALPGENTALLVASVLLILAVHILTAGAVLRVITGGDSAASPRNALAYAWGRRGDLLSLFFLNFLLGGAYALFIIPGIIFQVWFSLSAIVLIAEGRSGTEALLASREYVRGHDWAVFSSIGFLVFFALLISSVAELLPLPSLVRQGLTFALSALAGPFIAIYLYLIYHSLKHHGKGVNKYPAHRRIAPYLALGMLGWAFILIFGSFFILSLKSYREGGGMLDRLLGDTPPAFEELKELKGDELPPEAAEVLHNLAAPVHVYEIAR